MFDIKKIKLLPLVANMIPLIPIDRTPDLQRPLVYFGATNNLEYASHL